MGLSDLSIDLCWHPPYPIEQSIPKVREVFALLEKDGVAPQLVMPELFDPFAADRNADFERQFLRLTVAYPDRPTEFVHVGQLYTSTGARLSVTVPYWPRNRAEFTAAWEFARTLASRLVDRMDPHYALIYGIGGATHRTNGSGLPSLFTPWTWLSDSATTGPLYKELQALPDAIVDTHHRGLLIRPVPDWYGRPSNAFLEALSRLNVDDEIRLDMPRAPK